MSALRETQDLLADTTAELAATKARLAETLAELDKRAWSRGSDRFSNIEYCGLCHYSREWVAQHGHGEKCLLRNADSATVVQYKPCEICTTQSWCETHGCQCYPVSAVQPERCCLDYPRCDCNSPPEPDTLPSVCEHGIRHPWECRECADAAWEQHKRATPGDEMKDIAEQLDAKAQPAAVQPDADLLSFGYAPGNYESFCLTCEQRMTGVDKRCHCCRPCAKEKWGAAEKAKINQRQVPEGMALYKGEFVTARMVVERLAEAVAFIEEVRAESAEDFRTSKYVVVQMTTETWEKLKADSAQEAAI